MSSCLVIIAVSLAACRTQSVYELSVECRDGAQPVPLVTSRNVTVRVVEAGSDVPRFTRCVYDVSLDENNRPGARLMRVSAADRDARRNASVRYSLGDDAQGTQLKPNSITLASSELAASMFGASSELVRS